MLDRPLWIPQSGAGEIDTEAKHLQRSNVQRRRGVRNRRQYLGDFVAASRLVSPAIGQSLESASHGRESRLVARTEPQRALARTEAATPVPVLKKDEAAAVLSPWFANLMNALSNQVQIAVSEIAAMTLANERKRLLDEFRFQIQNEATGTIEHVIATSKDELARRALKVLNEGAQAIVKNSQGSLVGAIERHIENAQQNLDTMATGTVERVQRNLETSRTKATERFVLRLREQVAPVMEEVRADFQKLVASQTVFKEESLAIYRRVTDQLESDANARLLQTHDQLEKTPLPL